MEAGATFEIVQGAEARITSTVQQTVDDVIEDGEWENRISQVEQTASGLTSTVQSHTASINTINSSISTIKQTASSIQTQVTDTSNRLSTLTQTASSIQTQVTDTSNRLSTISQTVDNISLEVESLDKSGFNYLKASDFVSSDDVFSEWSRVVSRDSSANTDMQKVYWSSAQSHEGYNSVSLRMSAYTGADDYMLGLRQKVKNKIIGKLKTTDKLCLSCWVKTSQPSFAVFGADITTSTGTINATIDKAKFGYSLGEADMSIVNSNSARKYAQMTVNNASYWNDTEWHRIYVVFHPTVNYSLSNFNISFYSWFNSGQAGSSQGTLFFTQPKLEINDHPTDYANADTLNGDEIRRTGIHISDGKIVLDSENTEVNGDLDLRGNFTSANTNTMNAILINATAGSIKMRGASSLQDVAGMVPTADATQIDLAELKFYKDADSLRTGAELILYGASGTITIDSDGIFYEPTMGTAKGKTWSQLLS